MLMNNILQDGCLRTKNGDLLTSASLFANDTNVNRLAAFRFPSEGIWTF